MMQLFGIAPSDPRIMIFAMFAGIVVVCMGGLIWSTHWHNVKLDRTENSRKLDQATRFLQSSNWYGQEAKRITAPGLLALQEIVYRIHGVTCQDLNTTLIGNGQVRLIAHRPASGDDAKAVFPLDVPMSLFDLTREDIQAEISRRYAAEAPQQ